MCPDRESWSERGHLFMVADGMGGHAVGELASKIAVDTVPHTFFKVRNLKTPAALKAAIETANSAIYDRGVQNRDFLRMGTTCSVLVLSPEGAIVGHVGDSRLYRIREGRVDQLTFDHSLQWELLKQGCHTPEEIFLNHPRNIITRSLGPDEKVQVDLEGPYAILPGDTYLLCSDGLTGHLKDSEIGIIAGELPVADACRLLVNLANLRGGSDNITVVMARVGDVPAELRDVKPSSAPREENPPGWFNLMAGWGVAAAFAAGISLALFGRQLPGFGLIGIAVIGLIGLLASCWARKPKKSRAVNLEETVYWKAYRTATVRLDSGFLRQLASLEANLQRSAVDEGWAIDWSRHEAAFKQAANAMQEKRHAEALCGYAGAIDALMAGLQTQRKQTDHAARWGKNLQSGEKAASAESLAVDAPAGEAKPTRRG
jgi:protein phosphatase